MVKHFTPEPPVLMPQDRLTHNWTVRQLEQIRQSIGDIARNFTYWAGDYDGSCYPAGAIVRDGDWTMVALRDTCDRPAPVPSGDPYWLYDGASPTGQLLAKTLTVGNDYTFTRSGYFVGWRVYVVTGNEYSVWMRDGNGVVSVLAQFEATTTGWVENVTSPIPAGVGTAMTLAVQVQEPDPTPDFFQLDYDYDTPNNAAVPLAGQIVHANTASAELRVHKTPNGAGGPDARLDGLEIGDVINGVGLSWAIQNITDNGTWYNFAVAPATQGAPDGVATFLFETVSATPVTTVIDPLYYDGSAGVQPFYSIDGGAAVETSDGYGVDIQLQEVVFSEDWAVMSYSGTGSGGGTDPEIPDVPYLEEGAGYRIVGTTLECWGRASTDAAGTSGPVTFPKRFASLPTCTATIAGNTGNFYGVMQHSLNTQSVVFEARAITATAVNPSARNVDWHVIGVWDGN